MSWFTNALKIANVGMGIASKVEEVHRQNLLEQQGKEIVISQLILNELRNKIFVFNSTAKEVLEKSERQPKYSAAAMAILEDELKESGITSEIFPDIADKEYTSDTHKFIQRSLKEMYSSLSEDEQGRISALVKATNEVEKSQYFLDNYDDVVKMEDAKKMVDELEKRNGCLVTLLIGFYTIIGIPFILMVALGMIYESTENINQVVIIGIIGITAYCLIIYFVNQWKRPRLYRKAIDTYDELNEKINIKYFDLVEKELGSDYDLIEKRHNSNGKMIKEFWANS